MNRIQIIFLLVLFLITACNAYISQQYPRELFNILVNKDEVSSMMLLTKLQKETDFVDHLHFLSAYVGRDFSTYFTHIDAQKKIKIAQIETILTQNNNQPQVLFMLSKEYDRLGQYQKSKELRTKAHRLDPLRY